jgi:large subunit ribosomal protein L25
MARWLHWPVAMATNRPTIDVSVREEFGSRVSRRLRKSGQVPGVVYGASDGSCINFAADARELRRVLIGSGALIDLNVAGDKRPVILKDMQLHPVRGDLVHVDFVQVRLDEKIQTTVPLHAEGGEEAPGVKEGGVLELPTHTLNIEALPTAIPDSITIDVSGLAMQETMHLSAITPPEGVEFLDNLEETIIATIVIPSEEPAEPELEEEAGVVGEEAEGEAGAEGATGDEAEQAGDAAADAEASGE